MNHGQTPPQPLTVAFIANEIDNCELDHPAWEPSREVIIDTYWNAEAAPPSRHFAVRALWCDQYLYVRFETVAGGELNVSSDPRTDRKTIGLWDRDVCEIFIAPDRNEPRRYFEFEVAPTGEWLDLEIDLTGSQRITNWEYDSRMESAATIEKGRATMAIKIPWTSLGAKPKAGDEWLGNIFRCVGHDPDRGYLAWSPTMTRIPNFHVPERFGRLIFDN